MHTPAQVWPPPQTSLSPMSTRRTHESTGKATPTPFSCHRLTEACWSRQLTPISEHTARLISHSSVPPRLMCLPLVYETCSHSSSSFSSRPIVLKYCSVVICFFLTFVNNQPHPISQFPSLDYVPWCAGFFATSPLWQSTLSYVSVYIHRALSLPINLLLSFLISFLCLSNSFFHVDTTHSIPTILSFSPLRTGSRGASSQNHSLPLPSPLLHARSLVQHLLRNDKINPQPRKLVAATCPFAKTDSKW